MKNNEEQKLPRLNINWYPGHMVKTKREIKEDLKLIDVVIEILDARIPISSRNPEINNIIDRKKRIIILNKYDLADDRETERWQKHFKEKKQEAVLVNSNSGKGINNVLNKIEELMKEEIKENEKKGRVGKTIRVLVVGIPNVGKSSFINRISKRTTAKVRK